MYKNIVQLFSTLRKDILFLFLFSISIIICIDFWLINIQEIFKGGAKFGEIIYRLCMSYISAFIFYFLVVHIKTQKDKKNIFGYVFNKVNIIIGSSRMVLIEFQKAAGVKLNEKYSIEKNLHDILNKINPNETAPMIINNIDNYANWIQYLNYQKTRSKDSISNIFYSAQFIDTELIKIIKNIDECTLFQILPDLLRYHPLPNTNFLMWEDAFVEYFFTD